MRRILLAMAAVLCIACADRAPAASSLASWPVEWQIIHALAQEHVEKWRQRSGQITEILIKEPVRGEVREHDLDPSEAASLGWGLAETWDLYFAAEPLHLAAPAGTMTDFHVVSGELLSKGLEEQSWNGRAIGFPSTDGYFVVTRLVIHPDGGEALVEWGFICGGLCGQGAVSRLALEQGRWIEMNTIRTWIS